MKQRHNQWRKPTMTETQTQTDSKVERPSVLQDLDEQIQQQKQLVTRLDELQDDIKDTEAEAAQLDLDGREVVAEEMLSLKDDLVDANNVDDLESVQESLSEVVADPYREAVKTARETVLDTLSLKTELDDEKLDTVDSAIQERKPADLRTDQQAFQDVSDMLGDITAEAQAAVASEVQDRVVPILTESSKELKPLVDDCVSRHDTLDSIDEQLPEATWVPDVTLAETSHLYEEVSTSVERSDIADRIEVIDDGVSAASGKIPLDTVVMEQLKKELENSPPDQLAEVFKQIAEHVVAYNDQDHVARIQTLLAAVDDPKVHQAGVVEEAIQSVREPENHEILDAENPLQKFSSQVNELEDIYQSWVTDYVAVLRADAEAVTAIDKFFEESPDFETPADGLSIIESLPENDTISANPDKAVASHRAYLEWREELFTQANGSEGAQGGSETAKQILQLVRGDKLSGEEVSHENYAIIVDQLGAQITLTFEQSMVGKEEE